ncbi:MAG TPA: LacI family DNA-binding transcriptional regulator [Anaerolineales bacterium]|nr:LacI family DNA-binding transcriptional regulator [Anaerolineales bacterium]
MKTLSESVFTPRPMNLNPAPRSTIADVARLAGVSISTVSRVLNNTAPVADETIRRVREAIETLRFTPHAAARQLASRKTNTVGLLLPTISGSFFPPMLRGIERGARERGYDLLIYATQNLPEEGHPRALGEHNTDGLLIFTDSLPEAEMVHLYQLGFPMVLLHQSPPEGVAIPCVTFENKGGVRRMMDYLIETRGYRRIAFLTGPENTEDAYWRELGYRETLTAHGIPFNPDLVKMGGFDEQLAQIAVQEWLAEGVKMDAIFAADDDSAAGVLAALRRGGVAVPDQIAVVGFDDVPHSRFLSPPLTTVRAPIETAGYEAVRHLISLVEGEEVDPLILLPTELVIRRSCGNPDDA